jgi:DNA-binding SARP family transcriptional activator
MFFEVTGPLRVTGDDGHPVKLPRGRVRQLLAVLLLMEGPVAESQLCEWLSGTGKSITGSTLRTHVTALRRALGDAACRVRTEPAGYQIDVRPGECDLQLFHELAIRGRSALYDQDYESATTLLRTAAELWREPALADLPDTPDLWPQMTKLAEERRLVCESLIDAMLGLGRHREVIPELLQRCEIDPPQERTFEQLMTALYRSGRRAEAFDVYRSLCSRLSESHGADPGPVAKDLHQRILTDDSELLLSVDVMTHDAIALHHPTAGSNHRVGVLR